MIAPVGLLFFLGCRITAMTYDTPGRVAQPAPQSHDPAHHPASRIANGLDALMARQTT